MGTLHYANGTHSIRIPDDVLAHFQVVATTKLRRNESFTLSWRNPDSDGVARSTLWMQPSIPLLFEFDTAEHSIDQTYLRTMAEAANSNTGVVLEWEPEPERQALHAVAA